MRAPRTGVVVAVSLLVLAACGSSESASTSTADPTTTTTTTTTPTTTVATTTQPPATSTMPPPTTTTTTEAPSGPLVLLDTQPIVRGNLYTNPGAVVEVDGTLHMFRNQFSAWPGRSTTYHLTSTDGLEWEDRGVVFDSDSVAYTEGNTFIMEVVPGDDGWVGYFYTYEGTREPGHIGRVTAPSLDGPWTPDAEPVLSAGPEGAWDGVRVAEPSVIATDGGYVMYYAGIGDDRKSAIGMATSDDGITWAKYDDPATDELRLADSDPVLTGDPDSWNVGSVGDPDIERRGDGFVMIFDSGSAKGLARAASQDGVVWEVLDEDTLLRQDTAPNRQPFWQYELVLVGDVYRFYLEVGLGTGPTNVFAYEVDFSQVAAEE